MAALIVETQPLNEPIAVITMKNYLRVDNTEDDILIGMLITAARELVEGFTGRSLVTKGYVQSLDSFPYYVDTVMSQMAYPPSYYSLPMFSTTLWNYSQMIKLLVSPLKKISRIVFMSALTPTAGFQSLLPAPDLWYPGRVYPLSGSPAVGATVVDFNGNLQTAQNAGTAGDNPPAWNTVLGGSTNDNGIVWVNGGPAQLLLIGPAGGVGTTKTFFTDNNSEPPRIFPGPAGSFWPPVLYVPNAVQIHFTAGYGDNVMDNTGKVTDGTLIPGRCLIAIQQLVAGWYEHRESISPLTLKEMPNHIKALLWNVRVLDMQPTRG